MIQNNYPNPSRKGYQKNQKLAGNPIYCCSINIETNSDLNMVKPFFAKSNLVVREVNLFFGSQEEIYSLYRNLEPLERIVYVAVFGPDGECETENT